MKGSYVHHKQITAAQGVKIAAPGLENAVAGTQLLVVGKDDNVSLLKEEVMQDMESIFDSVDRSGQSLCSACDAFVECSHNLLWLKAHLCCLRRACLSRGVACIRARMARGRG